MVAHQELKHDLLDIFSALGDLRYQYDWVMNDHNLWCAENYPEEVRRRWQWTGLLTDGTELTAHLSAGYIRFLPGGVLSAVPKGTQPCEVWNYEPCWEIENFGSPEYRFQPPLTELELICDDGYAWILICPPDLSKRVKSAFPAAKSLKEFYRQH